MRTIERIKPLLVLFIICWTIEGIGITLVKDIEYKPMPGQYGYEYGYNENKKL